MEDQDIEDEDQFEVRLSLTQIILLGVSALLIVYFSMTLTNFLRMEPGKRTVWNLFVPFETGPSAHSLHKKGVNHYRKGDYKKAISYFDRSLRKEKTNAKGFFLAAGAEAKLGRFDRAMERLAYAEQLNPALARIYVKRAYWLLGLKQYKRAIANARDYVSRSSVPVSNKFYGFLVILEASKALKNTSRVQDTRTRLNDLKTRLRTWQTRLYENIVSGSNEGSDVSKTMSRGEKTELKAWRAIMHRRKGRLEQAREAMKWVLEEGDQTRYEYEMMLFMKAAFTS
jgi:tetratricopeptide (TPR) repeat protein